MKTIANSKLVCWLRKLLIICLIPASMSVAYAEETDKKSAADLRTKYGLLQDQLRSNQFNKPIYLDSKEKSKSVAGDIYALINHPFSTVSTALSTPDHWCDILMLHLNTKYCHASTTNQGAILNVNIGKKHDQPLDEAHRMDFSYRVATKTQNYLQVKLNAESGPLSTRDYKIIFESIPLENGRTFMHLSYSYAYGFSGNLAMQAYLNTVGSGKVGFTVVDKKATDKQEYVGGMRGVVERNTMRYYLAIEAFLGALSAPPQAQLEKRLLNWFTATEQYPRQLHEIKQSAYLDMKRKEHIRQQTTRPETAAAQGD